MGSSKVTRLQRQDGSFSLLDAEPADNGVPDDPSVNLGFAYFKLQDARFLNVKLQNPAGVGTADVQLFYSDLDAPTVATDWAQDENVATFALATATREFRVEPRGYKWAYLRAFNQAANATVSASGQVSG